MSAVDKTDTSLPFKTPDDVYREMMELVDEMVDENYHAEAGMLEDQAAALRNASRSGHPIGYFSWYGHENFGGLNEVILVWE